MTGGLDWPDRVLIASLVLSAVMIGWWWAMRDVPAPIDVPVRTITTQPIQR